MDKSFIRTMRLFGLIHVLIGLMNQLINFRRVVGIKTDADAGADSDNLILNRTRLANQILQFIGNH